MINWIELATAILSLFVPITDFILSRVSKSKTVDEDSSVNIGNQIMMTTGNGNVSVQGNENQIVNCSTTNIYPKVSTNTDNEQSGTGWIIILGIITIIMYATFKPILIEVLLSMNFLLLITVKSADKLIKTKFKIMLYITGILAALVLEFFIQQDLFFPKGYEEYLRSFSFQSFHLSNLAKLNNPLFYYMVMEIVVITFCFSMFILIIRELSRPLIYNLTINHFKFIAKKVKLRNKADFDDVIEKHSYEFLGFTIFFSLLLMFASRLFVWIIQEFCKLLFYMKSITR